jgi:hypothetical protein
MNELLLLLRVRLMLVVGIVVVGIHDLMRERRMRMRKVWVLRDVRGEVEYVVVGVVL